MNSQIKKNSWRFLIGVAIVAGAFGIYDATQTASATPSKVAEAPPAVPVVVQTLVSKNVRVWSEFSGRLQAVDSAEIKPEVSGRITDVNFADGQAVKEGDVLFVIDTRPYQAAVDKAEAALASAETNAQFANLEEKRAAGMVKTQAIAQRLYDERANSKRVADAAIQSAQAELKEARLNLEHANVKAPISGRVSRAEITVGNVVQAGPSAPLLTTIVSDQGIYADFDVDEQTYVQNIRNTASGNDQEQRIPVKLAVRGDEQHSYQGYIDSFDNHIDPASGTIRARAKFDNADGSLIPGMFVTVSMANSTDSQAIMVPEKALGFDQSKKYVYVVDGSDKVVYREVELGQQVGAERVALKGVAAGEKIIVDGLQHVRPDVVVAPKEEVASAEEETPAPLNDQTPAAGDAAETSDTQPAKP